jgi:hypothetical protein
MTRRESTLLPPAADSDPAVHAYHDDEETDWGAIEREGEAYCLAHDHWDDAKTDGSGRALETVTERPGRAA